MTPAEIAANELLRTRFLHEIAYGNQMEPADAEAQDDAALLASRDGALVVAWLWPHAFYGGDPFEQVALRREALRKLLQDEYGDAQLEGVTQAIDGWRRALRDLSVRRFQRMLESAARAVDHSVDDVKEHLAWSLLLAERDLDRMLYGSRPLPLSVIPAICRALQLKFVDESWVIVDPQRLKQRIDNSLVSMQISRGLRALAPDELMRLAQRLPRRMRTSEPRHPTVHPAPARGGRYDSLYETLSADERANPTYTLSEMNQILVGARERPLPASAKGRSWWAGSGAKIEGRPQLSAWLAAGYRVRELVLSDEAGVVAVAFEALPGRDGWLSNSERASTREYRLPEPAQIPVYPADARAIENMVVGLRAFGVATEPIRESVDFHAIGSAFAGVAGAMGLVAESGRLNETSNPETKPKDADIRRLVDFLREAGHANRSQVEQLFEGVRHRAVDGSWITNLLTRARRQGWIANRGTRSQPKWVLSPRCPVCRSATLQPISPHTLKCATCGKVVPRADYAVEQ